MSVMCSKVLVHARWCTVWCRLLQCYCTIVGSHISLLHLRKVIQLETDLLEWRRHFLLYNVLCSLCVASHPSGCLLSNVHCLVHYELDAIVQATTIYDKNRAEYMVYSGHVRGQRIYCCICTYNYMQYATSAYRSRAHFSSQHELGPRTPPLDVLTTCSWHGRSTCVWCSAPSLLYKSGANQQAPKGRHA